MLVLALAIATLPQEELVRTPAIYRCPAKEAAAWPERLESLMEDDAFDAYCLEPKPTAEQRKLAARYKVKLVNAKTIDTAGNQKWRNATIDYANGKISPKEWLSRTKAAKATVHFLSNPKAPNLRKATNEKNSYRAVFAEMLLLSWRGRPCLTSEDIWQTREFPGPGALQSWILAMNDYMGPMLYFRSAEPYVVTKEPKIISAPDKPGLFIFSNTDGKKTQTFYFNNSDQMVKLPKDLDTQSSGLSRGLLVEDDYIGLTQWGSVIVESVNK